MLILRSKILFGVATQHKVSILTYSISVGALLLISTKDSTHNGEIFWNFPLWTEQVSLHTIFSYIVNIQHLPFWFFSSPVSRKTTLFKYTTQTVKFQFKPWTQCANSDSQARVVATQYLHKLNGKAGRTSVKAEGSIRAQMRSIQVLTLENPESEPDLWNPRQNWGKDSSDRWSKPGHRKTQVESIRMELS